MASTSLISSNIFIWEKTQIFTTYSERNCPVFQTDLLKHKYKVYFEVPSLPEHIRRNMLMKNYVTQWWNYAAKEHYVRRIGVFKISHHLYLHEAEVCSV